jgi:hypothetical protein
MSRIDIFARFYLIGKGGGDGERVDSEGREGVMREQK